MRHTGNRIGGSNPSLSATLRPFGPTGGRPPKNLKGEGCLPKLPRSAGRPPQLVVRLLYWAEKRGHLRRIDEWPSAKGRFPSAGTCYFHAQISTCCAALICGGEKWSPRTRARTIFQVGLRQSVYEEAPAGNSN